MAATDHSQGRQAEKLGISADEEHRGWIRENIKGGGIAGVAAADEVLPGLGSPFERAINGSATLRIGLEKRVRGSGADHSGERGVGGSQGAACTAEHLTEAIGAVTGERGGVVKR